MRKIERKRDSSNEREKERKRVAKSRDGNCDGKS